MNFKALLATAAIATASFFTGGEAMANQKGGAALFYALQDAGVEVKVSECEDDSSYGFYRSYVGAYQPGMIQICTNVAVTENDRYETLRHEAVHAAQHCRGWDTVMKDTWMKQNVTQEDKRFVMSAYDKSDWIVEIEAFTLEHFPNAFIAKLVNINCN